MSTLHAIITEGFLISLITGLIGFIFFYIKSLHTKIDKLNNKIHKIDSKIDSLDDHLKNFYTAYCPKGKQFLDIHKNKDKF